MKLILNTGTVNQDKSIINMFKTEIGGEKVDSLRKEGAHYVRQKKEKGYEKKQFRG